MDEPSCKTAFNNAAPKRVVKVKKNRSKKTSYKPHKKRKSQDSPLISLDPAKRGYAPIMTLDVETYLHQFKDFVMTEEEKVEVLQALWEIMCRFVELGFGMDSQSLACAKRENKARIKDGNLIDLNNPE